jgi:mannose-6-phosphate isomerase-like protein (cupin superfamily)
MNYYRGNFYNDREREFGKKMGWIVGRFMDDVGDYRHSEKVSIRFWIFKKGQEKEHKLKYEREAVECTFILKGSVRGVIDGQEEIFHAGEYVVIPAKIKSNMIKEVIDEPVEGLTIKAPSLPEEDSVKMV